MKFFVIVVCFGMIQMSAVSAQPIVANLLDELLGVGGNGGCASGGCSGGGVVDQLLNLVNQDVTGLVVKVLRLILGGCQGAQSQDAVLEQLLKLSAGDSSGLINQVLTLLTKVKGVPSQGGLVPEVLDLLLGDGNLDGLSQVITTVLGRKRGGCGAACKSG